MPATPDAEQQANDYICCPHCDALSHAPVLNEGFKIVCKRCGAKVYERKCNTIDRTLALSLAGLLLAFPAMFLPIIGVGAIGMFNQASLIDCITLLISSNYNGIALCIFLFTVAIPIVRLLAAGYITWSIKYDRIKPSMLNFFRSYHQLDSWTMLHVFLLGIMVSMYKLIDLAELHIGIGFIAFIALLICSTTLSVTLDHHYIWQRLEQSLDD